MSTHASGREFLSRLWALENDDRPGALVGYVGPRVKGGAPVRSALFSTEGRDTVKARLLDPDKFLAAQLEEIEGQSRLRGDLVPALCPTLGVIAVPSAFGAEVVWWENDFPAVRPLVGDDIEAVGRLKRPALADGELGRILRYTRVFLERTEGRMPIRLGDIQGPLDNAALIFGHTSFLEAVLTAPRAVHRLLDMITDLMIEFASAQRELVRAAGAEFVPSSFQPWLADGGGISVANDVAVMLSPELHDEFGVPYLNRLSDAFGGVYIHSCGDWTRLFPSLEKVRGLRGLEFGGSEAPYDKVLARFGGKTVLACRVGLNRDIRFAGMADYVRRVVAAAPTPRGLFIHVDITNGLTGEDWPETDLDEIFAILDAGNPAWPKATGAEREKK
ncbi:MAG TPA: uroporphyrinogen decarboxylase family protein [Candidatus Bathyarchaeia archaeon]|nr:uroporphyrinogen decarboxylase family protein [Candidatus Bathyarchaeia archaeon]